MKKERKGILKDLKKPNIVFLITDQQTWNPNYADGFPKDPKVRKESFPAMDKLLKNSMAFQNAHCNSCTCTPSRTTIFTGTYPAVHGATQVLAFDDPFNNQDPPKGSMQIMQGVLKNNMTNMFRMMEAADYQVAYKGKWHITKPTQFVVGEETKKPEDQFNELYWTKQDGPVLSEMYGAHEWNYPDAGDDGRMFNFGGGDINNDGRFVDGDGQSAYYGESISKAKRRKSSAVNYINNVDTNDGENPFFLVVSLVNPHDVLSYPGDGVAFPKENRPVYKTAGYKDSDFQRLKMKLPNTWNEKLKTKPKIQKSWRRLCQAVGKIGPNEKEKALSYIKFYAHLTSVVDKELDKVLVALQKNDLYKNTLFVRISDHGDMGMSHGRQRQKMYNTYEQTINIPMIFSHPLFKTNQSSEALVGLIDLMPTMADIVGANSDDYNFQGKSLVDILDGTKKEVQDHIHFTFDDNYATTKTPWDMGACHIRFIKKKDDDGTIWKYGVYFDPDYGQEMEYEMYNLTADPDEADNLAHGSKKCAGKIWNKRQELHRLLTDVMKEKGTLPDGIFWPKTSGGEVGDE